MASNINPNNIDGAYPVAGQDNNSQGFRDNFTNTKQNFQYAEDEINDLQAKSVLKAALIGQALDNNMNDNLIYAAKIQDFSATRVSVASTTGSITLNYASGHYQTITTTGSISLGFINWPAAGSYGYLRIQVDITNTAHTMTVPASVSLGLSGIQGISPGTPGVSNTITFGVTGKYEFAFSTSDGGATITLFDLNRALTNFNSADIQTDDITATGFVSAAGNVTGGNIRTTGSVSTTGNVIANNVSVTAIVSSIGNITGGNLSAVGTVVAGSGGITTTGTNAGFIRPSAGTTLTAPLQFTAGTNMGTVSAGALEYDGAAIYAAPAASQRGVMATQHFIVSATDYNATNNATAQKIFSNPTNGAVTLPASTTYFLDAVYIIAPAAATNMNAVTMSTLFNVTSALTNVYYVVDSSVGLATAVNSTSRKIVTAASSTVVTAAAPGGAESVFTLTLRGVLRTNLATTLTPQMAFSGTPGASAIRVLTSSYFRLIPVGTSSVLSVGNWS